MQLCAKRWESIRRNKGRGAGVPQLFFVLQTEKERFGYDSESCSDHKEDYAKAKEVLGNLEQILGYDDPSVYEARSSLEIEQMEWPE